jgi:CubicO group peptidase (beta-lactamase class C family)
MSKYEDLSALMLRFVEKGPAGCACALAKDGKILYEGYFGKADLENSIPVTADTIFRLWSMTKVIICTAAMMEFEKGHFLLQEPLYEYFPEYRNPKVVKHLPNGGITFEEARNPLLIKHAFSMSVGLPYPNGDDPTSLAMRKARENLTKQHGKYTLRQDIKAIAEAPIAFEPGTHFLYGFGHELVAGMVEVSSGKSIGQYLKEEIYDPLEMTSTAYRHFGDTRKRMSVAYRRDDAGKLTPAESSMDAWHEEDAIYEGGGAGLFSTVRDYLTFSQMLANGGVYKGRRIIGRKTIDLMRRNQLTEEALRDFQYTYTAGYGYGLGVRTMMDPAAGSSNSSVGEFGWTGMAGTYTAIDPLEHFSIVYMHQMMPNMEEYHHHRIRAVAYGCLE